MTYRQARQYSKIEKAIYYIHEHFREQPSLTDIADAVNLSPFHFQRLFKEWAGVSPKKFMQYLSIEYAKELLRVKQSSLSDTAYQTGLSGSGRLHDLFIGVEAMTPGEYRNGGESLSINYCFAESPFGKLIIASTSKGICHLFFDEQETRSLTVLQNKFPKASYHQLTDKHHREALLIFQRDWSQLDRIKLHLNGTAFQLKVWEALLRVPAGALTTYHALAKEAGNPGASRAVGTVVACNPVAYLIPCHRVIRSTGKLGGYRWGPTRKSAMIGWEAARRATLP